MITLQSKHQVYNKSIVLIEKNRFQKSISRKTIVRSPHLFCRRAIVVNMMFFVCYCPFKNPPQIKWAHKLYDIKIRIQNRTFGEKSVKGEEKILVRGFDSSNIVKSTIARCTWVNKFWSIWFINDWISYRDGDKKRDRTILEYVTNITVADFIELFDWFDATGKLKIWALYRV